MQGRQRRFALLAAAVALGTAPAGAHAASFTVDTPADAVDASEGDGLCATATGVCTLRAAVQEAGAADGKSTITVPAGTYRLTIVPLPQAGSATDMNPANGDLDLEADITVRGAGVGRTVIDGGGIDRVFETGAGVEAGLVDLSVTHGDSTAAGSQEIDLGGGILNKSGITLERVELVDNKADGGGGMFSIPGTMPTIRDSLITGNSAFEGGGLRIDHGATIVNTTITGNRLLKPGAVGDKPVGLVTALVDEISGYGGGIDHRGGALLELVNSTITGNHALKGGGGLGAGQGYAPLSGQLPLGKVTLRNTIIFGNTSESGPQECRTNQVLFTSLGHNIAGDTGCFLTAAGDRPGTDPLLGPLADNGGPARTLALTPGSPAIDAGAATGCPATDARGIARPQGLACDIGAFEVVPTAPKPCVRSVTLPARLRGRARSFDVLVAGRVVARKRRPSQRVVLRGRTRASRATLRVHLRSGRTLRLRVPIACKGG
jgi:CSLREA domain-containing protein